MSKHAFTDNNPPLGVNHYRLKMVDADNTFKYSAVRTVRNENNIGVTIYPNPAKDVLNVFVTTEKAGNGTITITDMNGQVVQRKTVVLSKGNNFFQLNISHTSLGSYIITTQSDDGVSVQKFNKVD